MEVKTQKRVLTVVDVLFAGIKLAIFGGAIAAVVAYFGAWSLLGVVFISGAAIATILTYTVVGFVIGALGRLARIFMVQKTAIPVKLVNLTGK